MNAVVATGTATEELVHSDAPSVTGFALPDDLSREVYCIFGMPVDFIGMHAVLRRIESAAAGRTPFLISTPNLNFLVNSQLDRDFRESLILSDLCTADGMPIIWIAWLTGIPIKYRIAGSDIFDALKAEQSSAHPLKIFLFRRRRGCCSGGFAGAERPTEGLSIAWDHSILGFCSVDEMSRDEIIDNINASGADFLVVSLGAQKGQLWLQRNHHRLVHSTPSSSGCLDQFSSGHGQASSSYYAKIRS